LSTLALACNIAGALNIGQCLLDHGIFIRVEVTSSGGGVKLTSRTRQSTDTLLRRAHTKLTSLTKRLLCACRAGPSALCGNIGGGLCTTHSCAGGAGNILDALPRLTNYAPSGTRHIGKALLDSRNAPKGTARNRTEVGLCGLCLAPSTRKCIGHEALARPYLLTSLLSGTCQPCLQSGGLAPSTAYCTC